jgi:hypothetical protein
VGTCDAQAASWRYSMLDLFYIVIGAAGFLALWAIAIACERV